MNHLLKLLSIAITCIPCIAILASCISPSQSGVDPQPNSLADVANPQTAVAKPKVSTPKKSTVSRVTKQKLSVLKPEKNIAKTKVTPTTELKNDLTEEPC